MGQKCVWEALEASKVEEARECVEQTRFFGRTSHP